MTSPDDESKPGDEKIIPEAMAAGRRALAAIVFTDTVGFSALMSKDEERALRLVARDLNQMKETCAGFGGQVLKTTGDGLLVLFTSAVQAVACALEIQRNFQQQNLTLPKAECLRHRIGIHLGDVFQNGSDVMGDGVNIAARLQTEAVPGGICLSKTVYDVVANRLQFYVNDLGARKLKNIGTVTAYQISPMNSAGGARFAWYRWRSALARTAAWCLIVAAFVAVFWIGVHRQHVSDHPGQAGNFTLIPVAPEVQKASPYNPAIAPVPAATAPAPMSSPDGLAKASEQDFEMARFDYMRKYDFEEMRDWIATHDWPEKPLSNLDPKVQQMQHLLRWLQEELHAYSASSPLTVTGPHGHKTSFWTVSFGGLRMKTADGQTTTVMREQIPPKMIVEIIKELLKEHPQVGTNATQVNGELSTFEDYYNVKLLASPQ